MWLVIAAIAFGAQADTVRNPLANNPSAAVAGRRLYDQACQSCHGSAGQGDRGPALNGFTFTYGGADADLFHTVRAGVRGSQMPPFAGFSDEQVWQLVSYIRSLAPSSTGARPQPITVTTRDGVEVRGLRLNEDTFTLQLVDADGALHLFDKLTRADVRIAARGASFDRLVHADAEPQNWFVYWGNFQGTHYSALKDIDAANVSQLRVAWTFPMPGDSVLEATPLVVKDRVLVGITGGEFGARGFLDAYDAATGRRLWRWYSVPGPGEFGHETWLGDSWQQGGSPMWLTGSYDPELNLVYWTVGNPGPQIDRSVRGELDNLFSDSVVAIDPDTGERRWHYQFTPNDGHDWDSCQDVILVDRTWRGERRKLLLHADRNGLFYVIDRTNGRLLSGTPFVHANWFGGFDRDGRPIAVPGSNSSREGSFFVYPTLGGATNFQAPSYSPLTGWMYLEYYENGQRYVSEPSTFEAGRQYIGRARVTDPAAAGRTPGEPPPSAGIKAIDPETGKTVWDFKIVQGSLTNGVLATGGNVVFGAIRDGNLVALDAKTGAHLWHFPTGANMAASPISYAIDGKQYVAIAAGHTVDALTLPDRQR